MKQGITRTLHHNATLQRRLTAYSALAATGACALGAAPDAKATVVSSGSVSIAVPNNPSGIYLNAVTGATGTSGTAVSGYDFNPYGSGGFSTYFSGNATIGNAGLLNGTAYAVLAPGAVVSSAGTFAIASTAATELNYRAGVADGFFGIHFTNEVTGVLNYGYVELKTTGATGFPATILSYGYENTGTPLTVPAYTAVPEPTTTAAFGLGALALGAVAVAACARTSRRLPDLNSGVDRRRHACPYPRRHARRCHGTARARGLEPRRGALRMHRPGRA